MSPPDGGKQAEIYVEVSDSNQLDWYQSKQCIFIDGASHWYHRKLWLYALSIRCLTFTMSCCSYSPSNILLTPSSSRATKIQQYNQRENVNPSNHSSDGVAVVMLGYLKPLQLLMSWKNFQQDCMMIFMWIQGEKSRICRSCHNCKFGGMKRRGSTLMKWDSSLMLIGLKLFDSRNTRTAG